VHYIIHTFDSPELAELALPAAKKYASVAPSSAHALHMPSHIFTRLGLWNESINSNLASIASAQCYAEAAGIKGHWDEEIHGLDYLVYAYLQKGENGLAKKQWDYVRNMKTISPFNFKVAYAYASIPSRYLLENKLWKEAAGLTIQKDNFPLDDFPWEKAIVHFTRLLGAVHVNDTAATDLELKALNDSHSKLTQQQDLYKANQVLIQVKASEAWIKLMEGKKVEALQLMQLAADMEDKTEKHPVTPGEVIPARELLGDMLLKMNKPVNALEAYEQDLKKHPNRFNGLYGAAVSAAASGQTEKAKKFYLLLVNNAGSPNSERKELETARLYLKN
jgi:tetratricopeptide (TPR) repeat protein